MCQAIGQLVPYTLQETESRPIPFSLFAQDETLKKSPPGNWRQLWLPGEQR